jgi:hypothetical protein
MPSVSRFSRTIKKDCASAPLRAAPTSSQKRCEILQNFHNFISIFNSMSWDVKSSRTGANHLVTVRGSFCKWSFSEILLNKYCCDQVKCSS